MESEQSAEDLLVRVAERSESALGILYERFAPGLLALLHRILGERKDAELALQDVFLRLWNQAARLNREGISVSAWLSITARNLGVQRLRSGNGLEPLPLGGGAAPGKIPAWYPRAAQAALLEQRGELLKKVIKQLPPHQRQALELAVLDGCTEAEIALKLEEPLGRVKTELRAAMSFLRHRLRAVMGTWAANI